MREGLAELERRSGHADSIAYPHGVADGRVAAAAEAAGFDVGSPGARRP